MIAVKESIDSLAKANGKQENRRNNAHTIKTDDKATLPSGTGLSKGGEIVQVFDNYPPQKA